MVDISSDEAPKGGDEIESLMNKYDKEEEKENNLHSDAYKNKIKQKESASIKEEQEKVAELEKTLNQIEDTKGLTKGELTEKKMHAAEDDDFLQGLLSKYAQNGQSGIQVITKDQAYLAASQCVKRWRNLSGTENSSYLKENFENAWEEHDVNKNNKIDLTEAYTLMKEI